MYGMSDNFRFCYMENLKGNFHEKMDERSRMQGRWKWKIRPCTTYNFLTYNFFLDDLNGKYIFEENHENFWDLKNYWCKIMGDCLLKYKEGVLIHIIES